MQYFAMRAALIEVEEGRSPSVVVWLTYFAVFISLVSLMVPLNAAMRIFRTGEISGNFLTYALLFLQAVLWLQYALLTGIHPILYVNLLATFVSGVYLVAFFWAADGERVEISRSSDPPMGIFGYLLNRLGLPSPGPTTQGGRMSVFQLVLLVGILSIFPNFFKDMRSKEAFLGSLATVASISVNLAPLRLTLKAYMTRKISSDFPVGMAITGLLGSLAWGVCAIYMGSRAYLIANVIGLILCGVQLGVVLACIEDEEPEESKFLLLPNSPEGMPRWEGVGA